MSIAWRGIPIAIVVALALQMPAGAQSRIEANEAPAPVPMQANSKAAKASDTLVREKLNAWTVGLAGGLLEGAPLRFAAEIGRVVDDGDNLHVLPIVTRGPAENVELLLYLKGVDAAIINADALQEFKSLVPNIQQRINYILSLFQSEFHIFVRPEINSLADLAGKRVNFNTPGTSAAYSGPLIFDRLKINVEKTFIPHQLALEQMRKGDIAAVVFVTSKPVDAFARGKWEPGFKFLPIEYDSRFEDNYLPALLDAADYPQIIGAGAKINTIAVPTILVSYNWPKGSVRYNRVSRFIDHLYGRIDKLQEPGFHPKWKDINLATAVPGLTRAPAAQEWLDRATAARPKPRPEAGIDPAAIRSEARQAAPRNRGEANRLFREFLDWRQQRQ